MAKRLCIFLNMAPRVVAFALLVLTICKVQSQGCNSNLQQYSSKGQSSCGCGSQPQSLQYQSSNNNGVKASPQLQIVPNQSCNLQAIPLSQLMSQSQGSNFQRGQTGINLPKQNIQVSSVPQIPSSCAQCTQSQTCNSVPSVISAPVSTITIPPTSCTTIIDNSLSNSLANALQMMIANDFINSAISNNIVNQDCLSIPVVETSVPLQLSSFVKNLNAKQLQQYQSPCTNVPDDQNYDWDELLGRLQGQCAQSNQNYDWDQTLGRLQGQYAQPKNSDWTPVLNYLNSKTKEPENDYGSFKIVQNKCNTAPQFTQYQEQKVPSQDDYIIEAIKAYLSGSSNSCGKGNVAEVVFPEEIPAQLVCNYGYMPATVPMVSFEVQPVGDCYPNFIVGPQTC